VRIPRLTKRFLADVSRLHAGPGTARGKAVGTEIGRMLVAEPLPPDSDARIRLFPGVFTFVRRVARHNLWIQYEVGKYLEAPDEVRVIGLEDQPPEPV